MKIAFVLQLFTLYMTSKQGRERCRYWTVLSNIEDFLSCWVDLQSISPSLSKKTSAMNIDVSIMDPYIVVLYDGAAVY